MVGALGACVGVEVPDVAVRVANSLEEAPGGGGGHHEEDEKAKSKDFGSCLCHKDSFLDYRNVHFNLDLMPHSKAFWRKSSILHRHNSLLPLFSHVLLPLAYFYPSAASVII